LAINVDIFQLRAACVYWHKYTVSHKNIPLIFDYNFCVSWWSFTLFAPIETGKNTFTIHLLNGLKAYLLVFWDMLPEYTSDRLID